MISLLSDFITVLLVLLGWLLGLLTAPIVERIRQHYRRRDVMRAITDELLGLRHTMAAASWRFYARRGDLSDAFIDKCLDIVDSYSGPDRNNHLGETIRNLRAVSATKRKEACLYLNKPGRGISVREYTPPLFATMFSDLVICPLSFQRDVLHVRHHLDIYNQKARELRAMHDKTFSELSDVNRAIIEENLEEGYQFLGERADIVVDAVTRICEANLIRGA